MSMLLTVLISTVIVVAASAWHPADRHYGMTAANEQYMRERNGGYAPEFHAVTEDSAPDTLTTVYTLPVESLKIGQTIGVVFRNPNNGWVGFTLATETGDVVLRIAVVVNYGGARNMVIFYAKENGGEWINQVYIRDFPFPEYGTTTRMVFSATVEEEGFTISSANGDYVGFYPYQGSLTYDKVKAIMFGTGDETATVKSILREIFISFPAPQ